jgi:hypothetical protein
MVDDYNVVHGLRDLGQDVAGHRGRAALGGETAQKVPAANARFRDLAQWRARRG